MNPIEILYSWQALLVAITASGLTQLIKTIYDISKGRQVLKKTSTPPPAPTEKPVGYRDSAKPKPAAIGKEVRQSNVWLNRVVLPVIPIVIGALIGGFVPLRPEVLIEYVEGHVDGWYTQAFVYSIWGAACGQFADYTFSKAKSLLKAVIDSRGASAAAKLGVEGETSTEEEPPPEEK